MVEEQNNRPKHSSGGMVRCDAMRREQNEWMRVALILVKGPM